MKNFNFDVFCDRFNSLIEGKSQLELSKEMNLSQPVISKLKKHTGQAPSADTVVRIANHFGVSADWLLGISDVKINTNSENAYKLGCDVGYQAAKNQIMSFIKEMGYERCAKT